MSSLALSARHWNIDELLEQHCEMAFGCSLSEALDRDVGETADTLCAMIAFLEEGSESVD